MIPALRVIRTESESSTGAAVPPRSIQCEWGVFGNCFFGTSPEGAASAERAVMETAAHGKRWANPSPTTVDQCFSE
jgi:hypothetical protein